MAFDALRPYRSQILGLIDQGRTLAQIADVLAAQHGVRTTPGTLSRFASSVRAPPTRPSQAPPAAKNVPTPELTPAQHMQVDAIALTTELLAEIHASRAENRDMLEHLAGKIAGLTADVTELEGAVERCAQDTRAHASAVADAAQPPLGGTPTAPASAQPKPEVIDAGVVLRIWARALAITGILWAVVLVLILLLWGPGKG